MTELRANIQPKASVDGPIAWVLKPMPKMICVVRLTNVIGLYL